MTDEANQGQPAAGAPASVPAPENQQQTQPPAPPANVPDKFAGKSIEDVVRSYQEVEKFAGDQARRNGELQSQLNYVTSMMQNELARQQQAQSAPPPPQAQAPSRFDWDKPEDSVRGVARTEVMQAMEALRYQQAASMAEMAKSAAMRDNPQVFQGLDVAAVDQVMQQGLRQRLIAPESVGRPETWVMAAWQLRGAQSRYGADYSPTPVKPVATEQPSGSRPTQYQGEAVVMDDALAQAVRKWGDAEGKPRDPNQLAKEISEARAKGRSY